MSTLQLVHLFLVKLNLAKSPRDLPFSFDLHIMMFDFWMYLCNICQFPLYNSKKYLKMEYFGISSGYH